MTIAMWNVDPSDFSNPTDSAQAIRDRVVQQFESLVGIGNSAIVLLHEEEAGKRPGLVTMLVEYFQGLKYTFVTVPQCYNNCGQAICGGLDTGVTFMGVESFFFP
uniref:NodB homology domain-containing protein n=1 Tax=Spongospora subterranea TaxID=70186 RepID=A0A0H5RFP2_9EUKA|eukprot:CRZ12833.1 hypothetical protein [Spongospora subterranea]